MSESDTINLLKKLKHKEILEVLSGDLFCQTCDDLLQSRILNLLNQKVNEISLSNENTESSENFWSANTSNSSLSENNSKSSTPNSHRKNYASSVSPLSVNSKQVIFPNGGHNGNLPMVENGESEEEKEFALFSKVGRKKDYVHMERINEKTINVLQGLELHIRVFNEIEQKNIVEYVYNLQRMGQKGELRERTYSEPRKWMRGKGRVTMQFGCCYNYAVDKNGNPPGIIRDEEVDPLPTLFKEMIKKMVRWGVLPVTCVPNSCIVNIYDEGDCIPPHIDHHDFLRPFCTVSFLTECNILFGSNLKIVGPGEFSGPVSIPLPVGSVLILNGNGANVAKHCVPAVPTKRISITFRKMDDSKLPYSFVPDSDLVGIIPFGNMSSTKLPIQRSYRNQDRNNEVVKGSISNNSFSVVKDDFPPLGTTSSGNRNRFNSIGSKR